MKETLAFVQLTALKVIAVLAIFGPKSANQYYDKEKFAQRYGKKALMDWRSFSDATVLRACLAKYGKMPHFLQNQDCTFVRKSKPLESLIQKIVFLKEDTIDPHI